MTFDPKIDNGQFCQLMVYNPELRFSCGNKRGEDGSVRKKVRESEWVA